MDTEAQRPRTSVMVWRASVPTRLRAVESVICPRCGTSFTLTSQEFHAGNWQRYCPTCFDTKPDPRG
jgi:hypothetical protein